MIKVSILYPQSDDSTFDMDYYLNSHIPMTRQLLGERCTGASVEGGISGGAEGSPPSYIAMGHLFFDSVNDFQTAIQPHTETLMSDIKNYTNVRPVIQISEVKL